MSFQKDYQEGPAKLSIIENAGQVRLQAGIDSTLGGGPVAQALSVDANVGINVGTPTFIAMAFDFLEHEFPGEATVIDIAKQAILAKLATA